jgi:hypothetical protein
LSPNIYCTNPECINAKRPIPLPYPSQPGASHHPSVWPPAYFETKFGCPECGLVSAYRKHDVNWLPSQQTSQSEVQKSGFSNVVWWSIEFWCGGENCRSRIKFQSLTSEEEKNRRRAFKIDPRILSRQLQTRTSVPEQRNWPLFDHASVGASGVVISFQVLLRKLDQFCLSSKYLLLRIATPRKNLTFGPHVRGELRQEPRSLAIVWPPPIFKSKK